MMMLMAQMMMMMITMVMMMMMIWWLFGDVGGHWSGMMGTSGGSCEGAAAAAAVIVIIICLSNLCIFLIYSLNSVVYEIIKPWGDYCNTSHTLLFFAGRNATFKDECKTCSNSVIVSILQMVHIRCILYYSCCNCHTGHSQRAPPLKEGGATWFPMRTWTIVALKFLTQDNFFEKELKYLTQDKNVWKWIEISDPGWTCLKITQVNYVYCQDESYNSSIGKRGWAFIGLRLDFLQIDA